VACFTSLAGFLNLISGSFHRTSYSPWEISFPWLFLFHPVFTVRNCFGFWDFFLCSGLPSAKSDWFFAYGLTFIALKALEPPFGFPVFG
jgi:hypothetical protein